MANRRRGTVSLPEELKTNEKLSTKKELARQGNPIPSCPIVPNKIRKNLRVNNEVYQGALPVFYTNKVSLSPLYDPNKNFSYLDQVFMRLEILGEGSFGTVCKARSREDQELYAIKRSKAGISMKDKYAEIRNNEKVGVNPYCVRFHMAWKELTDIYMKLEYCEISLANYTHYDNEICEELLWNILLDICKALDYLHTNNLLHLDVKPGNIMMKNGYFKLCDFGLLVDLNLPPKSRKSTLSDGDSKYLALEVLEGIYTPSCDIFGLGISLLECAADLELPDHGPLWQQLRHGLLPSIFYSRVSLGLQVIVERMLSPEHETRPSAKKLLKFRSLRVIEKKDKKYQRRDFAKPTEETRQVTTNRLKIRSTSTLARKIYANIRQRQKKRKFYKVHFVQRANNVIIDNVIQDILPYNNNNDNFPPVCNRVRQVVEVIEKPIAGRRSLKFDDEDEEVCCNSSSNNSDDMDDSIGEIRDIEMDDENKVDPPIAPTPVLRGNRKFAKSKLTFE